MFSYKASLASNPHTLASTCIVAYLVTWKRGALMPTRTTIFFCSTSRSTRGRWQPVQVFFLVLSSAKPNTEECAPVFYRIFFFRRFWASAEVKSSRWWIVSRNKWPFCGHFLNSLLPFQAWGSKLFFFSILSGIHGAAAMQTLIFFLPLVSWTSVSFKAIKLHSCGFNWSEQLAYLNVGKRKTELYFFCENRQILYIENKTYLQIYTANSFLGYELKFRDYIGFEGFDTRWKISLMIENFSQTIIK